MNKFAHDIISKVQDFGLLIIALATMIAMGTQVAELIITRSVNLADLLLLFIYLEVLSMVVIYLDSGQLPVRMPLYIAIVALARYLILDMKNMDTWRLVGITAACLVIAITIMVIRYGHVKYPYPSKE